MIKVGQIYKSEYFFFKIEQIIEDRVIYSYKEKEKEKWISTEFSEISLTEFEKRKKYSLFKDVEEEEFIPQKYVSRLSKIE